MKRLVALLLTCGVLSGGTSHGQVISITTAPTVTGLEGADLRRARHVLRSFFANERHPECYRILFSDFEGNLRVDFVPKRPDPVRYEGQPDDPDVAAPCGRNVGYVVDNQGNILRRIYSR